MSVLTWRIIILGNIVKEWAEERKKAVIVVLCKNLINRNRPNAPHVSGGFAF